MLHATRVTRMEKDADGGKKVKKGLALMEQLQTWDSLMELRINEQKLANHVNQLPLPQAWPEFRAAGGAVWERESQEVTKRLKKQLDTLLTVQSLLCQQFPSTQNLAQDGQGSSAEGSSAAGASDEEIPSDDELEEAASPAKKSASPSQPLKRKLKFEDYEPLVAKRHKKFCAYRNKTVQYWDDQTSFEQGSLKKFESFHVPVLKQIEQILADKDRLLKRSQLLRSNQRILGTVEEGEDKKGNDREPNIYDENDLYQQMLYEVINRKCGDDPVLRSKQWVAIQSMRNKVKRKVDTRASKGRKIRYNVVEKLVNFLAGRDRSGPQWTDDAMDNLFSSLGGQRTERKFEDEDNEENEEIKVEEYPTVNGT